jgi:hypothetical protein
VILCTEERYDGQTKKNYVVRLTDEKRTHLNTRLRKGHAKARPLTRARSLLLADEGKTDPAIADALKIDPQTGRNIRKRFAEEGRHAALIPCVSCCGGASVGAGVRVCVYAEAGELVDYGGDSVFGVVL